FYDATARLRFRRSGTEPDLPDHLDVPAYLLYQRVWNTCSYCSGNVSHCPSYRCGVGSYCRSLRRQAQPEDGEIPLLPYPGRDTAHRFCHPLFLERVLRFIALCLYHLCGHVNVIYPCECALWRIECLPHT